MPDTSPALPGTNPAFAAAWSDLGPAPRRALELAHLALRTGGLAVGAVLTDESGALVAEGRNRAYDPEAAGVGDGAAALVGTPLAHAELNALAGARTGWDLATHTLWSTQEPCAMCAAAADFTGIGTVRFLAADPWALSTGRPSASERARRCAGPVWQAAATALFLRSEVAAGGADGPTVRHMSVEAPLTAAMAKDRGFPDATDVAELFTALWPRLVAAAAEWTSS
ncbi:deaminase [Streptomyces sp. NPDC012769]|uniref:deaminase n=1 Tax=Streptomyces sp. NPDC012769 TaxID=3364848 RepID=UPI0036BFB53C